MLSRVIAQRMLGLRLGRAPNKPQGFQRLQHLAGAGPHGRILKGAASSQVLDAFRAVVRHTVMEVPAPFSAVTTCVTPELQGGLHEREGKCHETYLRGCMVRSTGALPLATSRRTTPKLHACNAALSSADDRSERLNMGRAPHL